MIVVRVAAVIAAVFALYLPAGIASAGESTPELVARGKYVFATAGGCACHTPPDAVGLNAGGQKFDLFIGVVYSRNITPDPETGIGKWTAAQVTNAIRRGERPDGSKLFPIHPYKYLGSIADDEVEALVAYLKSVTPIKSSVPARSLKIPVPSLTIPTASKVAPRDGLARGAYLAGGPGPQRSLAANITPHVETGIGGWTEAQIARFLRTGVKPSGHEAFSLMRTVIIGTSAGFKDLSEADAAAIARYLKTVPAIENRVR